MNNFNKLIISAAFSALTVFQQYPAVNWRQAIVAGIGTFLVYMVPNVPSVKTPDVTPEPSGGFKP